MVEPEQAAVLMARIDERTRSIEARVNKIDQRFEDYITKERFRPVELIAYGLAGGVLVTVLGLFMGQLVLN
jgi:hypothetical protein